MKSKWLAIALLLNAGCSEQTHATLEVDPNLTLEITGNSISTITILDVEDLYTKIAHAIISETDTRKQPSNNASAILAGLAQTFFQLGQAINSDSKEAQQQAALGIIGTVLNVAAHLAHHRPRDEKEKDLQQNNEEATKAIAHLTLTLLEQIEKESLRSLENDLPQTLSSIQKKDTLEEKINTITQLLNAATTAKQYLKDLFATTQKYLKEKLEPLSIALKQLLIYYLNPYHNIFAQQMEQEAIENEETKTISDFVGTEQAPVVIAAITLGNISLKLKEAILSSDEQHTITQLAKKYVEKDVTRSPSTDGLKHILKREIEFWLTYLEEKSLQHYTHDK